MKHPEPTPAASDRERVDVFLKPGEYVVGGPSHRVRTVLGSCVSVTLWHPLKRIGAMSHFMLSTRGGLPTSERDPRQWDAKYGDEALNLMLFELAEKGVTATCCLAKIFGGADMFPSLRKGASLAVGRRNGEATRRLLQNHGIKVIAESLFGHGHRQIIFDINTGHVWMRQVPLNADFSPLSAVSKI